MWNALHVHQDSELPLSERLPRSDAIDSFARVAIEGAAGMVPIVGGFLQSAVGATLSATEQRNLESWLHDLATIVDQLHAREGRTTDQILGDPVFYEAVHRVTREAMGTMRPEKLEMLRQALRNSGSWSPIDPAMQRLVLRTLDDLEPEHVRLLAFFVYPVSWLEGRPELTDGDALAEVCKIIFGHEYSAFLADRFLSDLYSLGLVVSGNGVSALIGPIRADPNIASELGRQAVTMLATD